MDDKELKKKLDIIFEREYYRFQQMKVGFLSEKILKKYQLKPEFERKGGRKTYISHKDYEPLLVKNPEAYELDFPNLKLLLLLYHSISHNKDNVQYFLSYMESRFDRPYKYALVSYLAFETLFKLGYPERAFNSWSKYFVELIIEREKNPDHSMLRDVLGLDIDYSLELLSDMIRYEYPKISEEELSLIYSNVRGIEKFLSDKNTSSSEKSVCEVILRQVNEIQYNKLESELIEGVNLFQIAEDRKAVKREIKRFGFTKTLDKALDKIENYYWDTSADEFDYSTAIKMLREFHSELIKEICSKIKIKTQEDYPTSKDTKISNLRMYMKKHLGLEDENRLINGLVDIINKEGAHTLVTEKEYFRLTKNMTIEVALLLLTKLEKFLYEEK